jgi:predicted nucleic acid-binding protein
MRYHLDTSALMAHVLSEPGWQIVDGLLKGQPRDVAISAITWLEFNIVARAIAPNAAEATEVLALYQDLLAEAIPATREIAGIALELRLLTSKRLPNADALIAATAKIEGATLVHRDPHLAAVPQNVVKQIVLPDQKTPATTKRTCC